MRHQYLPQQLRKSLHQAHPAPCQSVASRTPLPGLIPHNRDELKSERPFLARPGASLLAQWIGQPSRRAPASVRQSLRPSGAASRPCAVSKLGRTNEERKQRAMSRRDGEGMPAQKGLAERAEDEY